MVPHAEAACSALPTSNGTAVFTMSVPSAGAYRFWAHLYSPSASNNGVYLRIDSTYCQITVGDSAAIQAGGFTWVDYQNGSTTNKINVTLSAGNHTVTMAGLDPGVGVDKVLLLADTSCTPTGDGNNCIVAATPTPTPGATPTPQPTVLVTPSPGSGTTSGGATPVSGTIKLPAASGSGTKQTYLIDGKPVAGNKIDTTQLSDGLHTLTVVQDDPHGNPQTVKTQKLLVQNHLPWWKRVLDWATQPLHIALMGGLLLMLVAGSWTLWRWRGRGRTSLMIESSGPPSSGLVYPDASNNEEPKQ